MQIERILSLVICICIGFISQTAWAEESCPEGTMKMFNTQTQQMVCVTVENVATVSSSVDENYSEALKAEAIKAEKLRLMKARAAYIGEHVREGGWEFRLGLGSCINSNYLAHNATVDIKAMAGVQFPSSIIASFGLYLDLNMRPAEKPLFTMDVTLDPTLHLSSGRGRFSIALGFGAFVNVSSENLFGNVKEKDTYYNTYFEVKPAIMFDYYLAKNVFWGVGLDFPLVILHDESVDIWFDVDVHVGYRF